MYFIGKLPKKVCEIFEKLLTRYGFYAILILQNF